MSPAFFDPRFMRSWLDTAPDFLHYLDAKEAFTGSTMCEGEEGVFAAYLHAGRTFPDIDRMFVEGDLWSQIQGKPEFIARKAENKISYWWDERIERLIEDCIVSTEASTFQNNNELIVRAMASENRFERRLLSTACIDWLSKKRSGGRVTFSPKTQMGYVFLTCPRAEGSPLLGGVGDRNRSRIFFARRGISVISRRFPRHDEQPRDVALREEPAPGCRDDREDLRG
jgi:hypothetical protein